MMQNSFSGYGGASTAGLPELGLYSDFVRPSRSAWNTVILLALFLLPVSLVPATWGTFFRIPPLPYIWWTENLLLMFAVVVLALKFLTGSRISLSTRRWLLTPMLALTLWQIISLVWNERDRDMRLYSFTQSLLMCAAVVAGTLLASGMSTIERLRLARWLTWLVGGVVAVYAGLSLVFPGWRPSYDYADLSTKGLSFIRMYGPLGTSTTLNFVLLPMLGICVGMLFLPQSWKPVWAAAAIFFSGCVVLTGSRGGLLSFAVFCVLLLPSLRLRSVVFLAPVSVILACVIVLVGVPERFREFEDRSRIESYSTALRAWSADPVTIAFGTGHGELYSKLHDDSVRHIYGEDRWFLLDDKTKFGFTLRNSHSAFVRSLAETGIVGFVLQCIPLLWLLGRLLLPQPGRYNRMLLFGRSVLAGCVAMFAYMAAEEFFITAFWVTVLWIMFVVIGSETVNEEAPIYA
jgi:hypothetical protein